MHEYIGKIVSIQFIGVPGWVKARLLGILPEGAWVDTQGYESLIPWHRIEALHLKKV